MTNPRILIVDDEADIRNSYRSILEPENDMETLDNLASTLFDEDKNDKDAILETEFWGEEGGSVSMEEEFDIEKYQVAYAAQGLEAVEYIKSGLKENSPFSVVFLDMRMPPGINGLETAQKIRKLDVYVEIVIMTAYSDYSLEEIAEKIGTADRLLYFHKPFQPEQIQQLSATLSQRWYLEYKQREQANTI